MLVVDRLTFAYRDQATPYQFSFDAKPGEITAISGPSGSGKSTLLDLLAGFLSPVSGTIATNGTNIVRLPPEQRPVSLLLQTESLFEHLTAARNVALGLSPKTPRTETKVAVDAALNEVGLSGFGARLAAGLSGGQKQRVALARTLLRARPVLLLDEPFSALDDGTRGQVRSLVVRLTSFHCWHTILVSHHIDDINAVAHRHYRLDNQKLALV
ncbi:ATP-binding cassette domain-containing protein [Devosia algicola]|uniref:ATP-binding cassette domain-containing protein n=1 Tax=Devosia algicola TaxID=3026418 RepID=A0ABY7YIJ3_9HYPH|nr:ATP-binding cassette domain-containing protein [Devosia algicola]WDR01148.1 ATP-binding cassette domain-containing protein [Devosia algicola]